MYFKVFTILTLIKSYSTVTYTKHEDMDCLLYDDLYKMPLSSNTDIEGSKEWCNGNSNCYGFTVFNFNSYFKDSHCKNDLFHNGGRTTFLKVFWFQIGQITILKFLILSTKCKFPEIYLFSGKWTLLTLLLIYYLIWWDMV